MSLIIPANTLASGGYEVDNSLRFNRGSSDYLNRTPSSAGNRKTMTYSFWLKRSAIASTDYHWFSTGGAGAVPRSVMAFNSSEIYIAFNSSGSSWNEIFTNALFRDVSAWYHVVVAIDTTQSTASNRTRIYVNGSEITSFRSASYVGQNTDLPNNNSSIPHFIGRNTLTGTAYFDGYIAEAVCIDGSQLDPTSFGEFDEDSGIWKPIDVSGLTFGDAGFYLDFEDSAALGADVSGNTNNFTVNNLTAIDQSTDTCTNNFATMNPLAKGVDVVLSEGNLKTVNNRTTSSGNVSADVVSTFAVSSGKWYAEFKLTTTDNYAAVGVVTSDFYPHTSARGYGNSDAVAYRDLDGKKYVDGTDSSYGADFAAGDIIGIALNLDDNQTTFYKNGASQGVISKTFSGSYYFFTSRIIAGSSTTWETNFGGTQSFTISSGNQDPNGYGNFEYSTNGYYALNTKNLAEYG